MALVRAGRVRGEGLRAAGNCPYIVPVPQGRKEGKVGSTEQYELYVHCTSVWRAPEREAAKEPPAGPHAPPIGNAPRGTRFRGTAHGSDLALGGHSPHSSAATRRRAREGRRTASTSGQWAIFPPRRDASASKHPRRARHRPATARTPPPQPSGTRHTVERPETTPRGARPFSTPMNNRPNGNANAFPGCRPGFTLTGQRGAASGRSSPPRDRA